MKQDGERLRAHPEERFKGRTHVFTLAAELRDLRAEERGSERGHRQIALMQHGPVTQVLFAFEAGGELREHSARGLVSIHGLEGRLRVEVDGEVHEMLPGTVLLLKPEVPHNVRADEPSAMLLTVHLMESAPSHATASPSIQTRRTPGIGSVLGSVEEARTLRPSPPTGGRIFQKGQP